MIVRKSSIQAIVAVFVMSAPMIASAQWTATYLQFNDNLGGTQFVFGGSGNLEVGTGQVGSYQGATSSLGPLHAVTWSGSGSSEVDLNPAGASASIAYGASGGIQVGIANFGQGDHAGYWRSTAASWTDLSLPSSFSNASWAYAVSGNEVAGYAGYYGAGHATLWSITNNGFNYVDLNPGFAGAGSSVAFGVGGGQQVGNVDLGVGGGEGAAALWSGTASSFVNLAPAGSTESTAYATDGTQQVGVAAIGNQDVAGLWSGSAASWINLNPTGSLSSTAYGEFGGYQVGVVNGVAAIWHGSAASYIDLGQYLNPNFGQLSVATSILQNGNTLYIGGYAVSQTFSEGGEVTVPVIWTQTVPEPGELAPFAVVAVGLLLRRRKAG